MTGCGGACLDPRGRDVCRRNGRTCNSRRALPFSATPVYTGVDALRTRTRHRQIEQYSLPIPGRVPPPDGRPAGCVYWPRCDYARKRCRDEAQRGPSVTTIPGCAVISRRRSTWTSGYRPKIWHSRLRFRKKRKMKRSRG